MGALVTAFEKLAARLLGRLGARPCRRGRRRPRRGRVAPARHGPRLHGGALSSTTGAGGVSTAVDGGAAGAAGSGATGSGAADAGAAGAGAGGSSAPSAGCSSFSCGAALAACGSAVALGGSVATGAAFAAVERAAVAFGSDAADARVPDELLPDSAKAAPPAKISRPQAAATQRRREDFGRIGRHRAHQRDTRLHAFPTRVAVFAHRP